LKGDLLNEPNVERSASICTLWEVACTFGCFAGFQLTPSERA
jgi:hypothetical protein